MEHAIDKFAPGLENTPGWSSLSRTDQDWLLEQTSGWLNEAETEGLAAMRGSVRLLKIDLWLEERKMPMKAYIRTVCQQTHLSEGTVWTRSRKIRELYDLWRNQKLIDTFATKGKALLPGSSGIGIGQLITVAKHLPAPKSEDPKVVEGFITNKVRPALKENRVKANTERLVIRYTKQEHLKMAFNELLSTMKSMRQAKQVRTSAEKEEFLRTVVGMTMEAEAIPGIIRIGRIPVPEGMIIRRGRPITKKPAEKSA